MALFLDVADNPLRARASVVRAGLADNLCPSILEFQGLVEQDQDRIRARVFLELRNRWGGDLG